MSGFCKQQLWPLLHYLLPLSPSSTGRFNPELWQAYVKANKVGIRADLHASDCLCCCDEQQNKYGRLEECVSVTPNQLAS